MNSARLMILSSAIGLLVSGCVTSNRVPPPPAEPCSSLVPEDMKRPAAHATLGNSGDIALDWQNFGLAETGQHRITGNNLVAGWKIVEGCEARDRRAYERITAPWYAFWAR